MMSGGIEIRGLTIERVGKNPRKLVDRLSLTVGAGRVLALLGESGAGKSLTSLAVMDLLPDGTRRTGGEILVNRMAVPGSCEAERPRFRGREVAMIMQNPMSAFDAIFTIDSHFAESMYAVGMRLAKGKRRELAIQSLAEVGFEDPESILSAYPFQLSGGMLQRVMIAIALLGDPSFLIADEATTDLDTATQARVLALLKERRCARGLGMILITHDPGVALYMADEIAVMKDGGLVEAGVAADVVREPKEQYTQELIAAYRRLDSCERFEYLVGRRNIDWRMMTA